jgi:hypothetical protein
VLSDDNSPESTITTTLKITENIASAVPAYQKLGILFANDQVIPSI